MNAPTNTKHQIIAVASVCALNGLCMCFTVYNFFVYIIAQKRYKDQGYLLVTFYILAYLNLLIQFVQMLHQFTHPAHTKEIFLLVNTSILLHLILGLNEMWILKELNVLLNRFICDE